MKNHIIISLTLLLSLCIENANAQSFLNKLGKAIEKEVKKEVVKKIDQMLDEKAESQPQQTQQHPQQEQQQPQKQEQPQKVKSIVPTVVEVQTDSTPDRGSINNHEWVDLGLPSGTLWATCNIDATNPAQVGSLYAWGETAVKSSYTQENSKSYKSDVNDFSGNRSNDAATAKWGEGWRMPTKADFDELVFYCQWKYIQKDGRWGSEITSPFNNKSIFLPVTGYKDGVTHQDASGNGMYWTSTPHKDQWNTGAHVYQFGGALGEMSISERSYGLAIRAVADNGTMINTPSQGETNGHKWVDLGLPSGTKWATCNLGAASSENHGEFYAWAEITTITDKTSAKNKARGKWMSGIGGSTTYDAATAIWGEGWKIPTKTDFQELMEHCSWEWTSLGRIKGCKVTSKINGNYIFLPASGMIYSTSSYIFPDDLNKSTKYWASTPSRDENYINADALLISEKYVGTSVTDRKDGFPIRPVTK